MERALDCQPVGTARYPGLDGLRGLAALGVVLYHYSVRYDQYLGHHPLPHVWFEEGSAGVLLFFILSGFVISLSLERGRSAASFAVSRVARLYPTYWAALLITLTATAIAPLPKDHVTHWQALVNFTMLQGFFSIPHVDGAYWTLKPELSFYAVCLGLLMVRSIRRLLPVMTVLALLAMWDGLAVRYGFHRVPGLGRKWLSLQYMPYFALGVVLWRLVRDGRSTFTQMAFVCVLASIGVIDGPLAALGAVGAGATVIWATSDSIPLLGSRPLQWLGWISYSLYLIHQNVGYILIREGYRLGWPPDVSIAVTVAIMCALASFISALIEYPAIRAARRYLRRTNTAG